MLVEQQTQLSSNERVATPLPSANQGSRGCLSGNASTDIDVLNHPVARVSTSATSSIPQATTRTAIANEHAVMPGILHFTTEPGTVNANMRKEYLQAAFKRSTMPGFGPEHELFHGWNIDGYPAGAVLVEYSKVETEYARGANSSYAQMRAFLGKYLRLWIWNVEHKVRIV